MATTDTKGTAETTKRTRVPKVKLEATPTALRFAPEPQATVGGNGTLGYLRALLNSIPKSYDDLTVVNFSEDATTVQPTFLKD